MGALAQLADVVKAAVAKEVIQTSRADKDATGADVLMISGEQWATAVAP